MRERMIAADSDEATAHLAVPERRPLAEQMRQEDRRVRAALDRFRRGEHVIDREAREAGEPRERSPSRLGRSCVQVMPVDGEEADDAGCRMPVAREDAE